MAFGLTLLNVSWTRQAGSLIVQLEFKECSASSEEALEEKCRQFSTWLSERLTVVDIALADSRTFQKPLSKSASQDSTCSTTSTAQSTSSSKRRRKTPSQYVDAGTHHQNQPDNSEENEDVEAAGCVIAKQISEGALRIREEHLCPGRMTLSPLSPEIQGSISKTCSLLALRKMRSRRINLIGIAKDTARWLFTGLASRK